MQISKEIVILVYVFINRLSKIERTTFYYHLSSSFFTGITTGILLLQEVIAKKTLHAYDWQITIITMLMPISSIFSIYWAELIEGVENKSKYFITIALIGRFPLLFSSFITTTDHLIFILALYHFSGALMTPTMNSIIQSNYSKTLRGRLYGMSASIMNALSLVSSFTSGIILDKDESLFRILFAFSGVCGFICCYLLSRIPSPGEQNHSQVKFRKKPTLIKYVRENPKKKIGIILFRPIKTIYNIYKNDKDFFNFEINFFIYGVAFMIIGPVIPVYLVKELNLDYTTISIARGVIAQLGMILFLPFFGRLHDKYNPTKFCAYIFAGLSLHPLFLALSSYGKIFSPVTWVYLSFAIYSVIMAGVDVAWALSSIYFAKNRDASAYTGVHVTMVGVRGSFAPFIGYSIMTLFNSTTAFFVSTALFILASILMLRQWKKIKRQNSELRIL